LIGRFEIAVSPTTLLTSVRRVSIKGASEVTVTVSVTPAARILISAASV